MSLTLIKKTIIGQLGVTLVYSILNLRFDDIENKIKWDAFKLYTPQGALTDIDENRYFDVDSEEYLIERHPSLDKTLLIKITTEGIEAIEIEQGVEHDPIMVGLEGDIVLSGIIPADTSKDIVLYYKEVTDGNN